MRPLSDYLPLILPHVPGCPAQTAIEALSAAITEFLARTHLKRHCEVCQEAIEGQALVPVEPVPGLLESVVWVMADHVRLRPVDSTDVDPESFDLTGRPQAFWLQNNCIRLYPTPDQGYTIHIGVVVRPAREEEFSDSGLFEEWADALVSGTIARLTLIPSQPWSSADLTTYHRRQFEMAVNNARVRDRRTAPLRVKAQRFE